jgi:glucan phosphoethanolaminetransferase (alkaline phosphatase superfamily)
VGARLARVKRLLAGDHARALLLLAVPTLPAIAIDLVLRPSALFAYALKGKAIYGSSLLLSASFWVLPLWVVARLLGAKAGRLRSAGLTAMVALWLLPFATFCYGGQLLYYRVFHSYMGRDTVRLGIALRGTVRDWFAAWGGPWLMAAMALAGVAVTVGMVRLARRSSPSLGRTPPLLAVFAFVSALGCFWFDAVDSRFLQAATPDACFIHGVVHATQMAVTGQWRRRQGVSLRTPAPLPPLVSSRARPPDVVLIITESVRADATCSDPPPRCRSEMLDPVVPDRISLGKLTSQTPNTFSSSVLLWTGLVPTADFAAAHTAPVLWEIAHAVGYRTAYVSSQNPDYEDFGTFTRRAGIDVLVTGNDLGGMAQEQLGAPDERAVDEAMRFVRGVPQGTPYLLVVHLSNTHMPYRIDPALVPYTPESPDPLGDVRAFHNRYLDSVRMQERTLAGMLAALKGLPTWDDTAVVFVSDHGEQFREHGGLYHNHSLFEEEVRVPGWIATGSRALDPLQRAALAAMAGRRTYTQDVHETIMDLLGVEDSRATLPLAELVTGRSLLRTTDGEPTALLATSTSVWEPDDARYGVMRGDRLLFGGPTGSWACFDLAKDPGERFPRAADSCGDLLPVARREFGAVSSPR